MLRSEDMTICDVYLQSEAAFESLSQLGEIECVQFIDMNPGVSPLERHYVTDLCRCADLERSLINIRDEILKDNIPIRRLRDLSEIKPLHPRDMFEFENMIDSVAKDVKDMTSNHTNLIKLRSETKEIYYVLNHLDPILGDVEMGYTKFPKTIRPSSTSPYDRRQLKIITGVIDRSNNYHFQTMLWRISHGTIYYKEASNDDKFQNPITGRDVRKVAFVIVCHGEELQQRILKVCNGFNANLYRWPETHEDRVSTINELAKRMMEMDKVLHRTKLQRSATFRDMAYQWETWMTQTRKAKAIYLNLNLFNLDITSNTLIGQCWLAERNFAKVESALESSSELAGARSFIVKTHTTDTPPTGYRTTRFTGAFQQIISSYDYGRYKELNPGIFSVVLFPFLFGVMFGDVGHGLLLLIYGAWMINNENKYLPRRSTFDVWNLIFAGRYMILLMGFFSMFMGLMYNEWFSLCSKMMAAYWLNTESIESIGVRETLSLNPAADTGYVYKYGMDPGIKLSLNGFAVENSVKMKLAILLGISHLIFGLLLSICNMIYFKKYYAIIFHTLPRILFIICVYGWLCYLFFHKWLFAFKEKDRDYRYLWPNMRQEFLHFIFWSPNIYKWGFSDRNIQDVPNFPSLPNIQTLPNIPNLPNSHSIHDIIQGEINSRIWLKVVLYHIALACFPIMLIASPIYLYAKHRIALRQLEKSGDYGPCQLEEFKKLEGVDFKNLLMHRTFRTMEYGLAIISHMASYLRLWALSMAHTLLSRFLWDITLRKLALSDDSSNGIWKVIVVFPLWALITVTFLVFMDSLAIFIHVLRLQWIEFMSKFFKGGGIPFSPFSLVTVLDDLDYSQNDEETETLCRVRQARVRAGEN